MMLEQPRARAQKYFLLGVLLLGGLIVGGLVWAILAGPSQESGGAIDANLRFVDENDPTLGPKDARVTVRIFGDFQCPACKFAEEGVRHVRQTSGDKVRLVWNDFPLSQIHSNALGAANAARCAEEQGKFWEYHDALYRSQSSWANEKDPRDKFRQMAKELNLKEAYFAECLNTQPHRKKIADDLSEGMANRVDATPTFFVNTKRLLGVLSNDDWDRELKPLVGS